MLVVSIKKRALHITRGLQLPGFFVAVDKSVDRQQKCRFGRWGWGSLGLVLLLFTAAVPAARAQHGLDLGLESGYGSNVDGYAGAPGAAYSQGSLTLWGNWPWLANLLLFILLSVFISGFFGWQVGQMRRHIGPCAVGI